MPRNRMPTFLKWSRSYILQYGKDRFRRTWRTISDRYPYASSRVSVISFCSDCDKAVVTGGDTFANNITRQWGVACVNCAVCPDCCQCDWCNVGRHYTTNEFCTNCSEQNCRECCPCDGRNGERAPIGFFRNKPFFHTALRTQHKVNPTNRFIAAEIEVAEITGDSAYLEEKIRTWRGSVVEDGSLPATGFEINSAPAAGDKYAQQIEAYCEGLKRAGGSINTKCGLHVHVDARDYDYYDLRRLARAYAAIEPALFKMVPESRRNSRFAKKCGMEYLDAMRWGKFPYSQVKADILKSTYRIEQIDREHGRGLKKMKKSKYQDARYAALNIHSWFFRGTIECRLFNGTLNADKIINWGVMWAMILDYVANTDDDTVDRELPLTETAAFDNLLKMLTNDATRTFAKQRYEQYAKEVETGEKPKRKRTRPAPAPRSIDDLYATAPPPRLRSRPIRARAELLREAEPVSVISTDLDEWRAYDRDSDSPAPIAVGACAPVGSSEFTPPAPHPDDINSFNATIQRLERLVRSSPNPDPAVREVEDQIMQEISEATSLETATEEELELIARNAAILTAGENND